MRIGVVVLVVSVGCGKGAPAKPLPEAILGEWEVWCRTDVESKSSCLGREDPTLVKVFEPGGVFKMFVKDRGDTPQQGTWTLDGDKLVVKFEGGGIKLEEEYRARIAGDRLVMWYPSGPFGSVLGRPGGFKAAASPSTSGKPVSAELGGVRYTLALPAGYRLTRDDNNRRSYGPASGEGLSVRLTVSPRAKSKVGDAWVTEPCSGHDEGGVSSSGGMVDGVERDYIDIGNSFCIEGTELSLMCSTGHTRGWLEPSERDAALAICKSLVIKR